MTKVIREEKITKTTYIANDGEEFTTEAEALAYETKLSGMLRDAKWKKVFGSEIKDEIGDWINGTSKWYYVTISSQEDLVDFLALTQSFDTYFEDCFISNVNLALDSGKEYSFLVHHNSDCGYLSQYCPMSYTDKEAYEKRLEKLDATRKLLDYMQKFIKYEEPEAEN